MKKILLLAFALVGILKLNAQSQCGTDEVDAYLKSTNPTYAAERQKMEQEIYSILKNKQNNPNARISQNDCQPSGVFTIPVVVHVINLGEPIGTGTNISDAQIQGAIQGLNDRWRKVTGDGVDMEIQFTLAKRNPNNNISNGINRVNGSILPKYQSNGVSTSDTVGAYEIDVKNLSLWPSDKYINIWVVNSIRGGIAGFASYLDYYTLGGIMLNYSSMTYNSSTLAHEMGHVFHLNHSFAGDGGGISFPSTQCPLNINCLLDGDGICDTPPHRREECSSTTCTNTGNLNNSFKNYMSYCGNSRFTQGQKERARSILFNYYGWQLILSEGIVPTNITLEAGITEVNYFSIYNKYPQCPTLSPIVLIKNSGINTINSIQLSTYLDGILMNTNTYSVSILKDNSLSIQLASFNVSAKGSHILTINIDKINNSTSDYYLQNNSICGSVLTKDTLTKSTFCYDFEDGKLPSDWLIGFSQYLRDDGIRIDTQNMAVPLSIDSVIGCNNLGRKCLALKSWNIINGRNQENIQIYFPRISLKDASFAYLKYSFSYARDNTNQKRGLTINHINCSNEYLDITGNGHNYISDYMLGMYNFENSQSWQPKNCNQWHTDSFKIVNLEDTLNLSLIIGSLRLNDTDKVQNIYFDNICLSKGYYGVNISVEDIGPNTPGVATPSFYSEIGSNVTVSATPFRNPINCSFEFKNWTRDGVVVSTDTLYNFIVDGNVNLTAIFKPREVKINALSNPINGGIVTGGGAYPINCGNCCTNINLNATPNTCYNFKNWMKGDSIISTQPNFTYRHNIYNFGYTPYNLTANFEPKRYNITLAASPTNGGTVIGAGNFACDSSLTVKAKVKTGYKFTNWTEGTTIVSTDSNYTFLISGARSLKANFSIATGIKQTTINEISKIYPNPTSDILQVEINSKQVTNLTLNIIDMKGSLLETKTLTNSKGTFNTSFDVSKLSKGNYMLNLYDEEGMASYKFIVQ
jgi:hypothetical protein